jgi:hypothetical protein
LRARLPVVSQPAASLVDGLGARRDAEFAQDRRDVVLDRFRRHEQPLAYLRVAQILREQLEDL